jgi:hypothetical protein
MHYIEHCRDFSTHTHTHIHTHTHTYTHTQTDRQTEREIERERERDALLWAWHLRAGSWVEGLGFRV